MAKNKHLTNRLKLFKERVDKDLPIRKIILFGSMASGKSGKDSDVDLIIVSPKFKSMDFFERGAKMYDYWNLRMPVDFLCYTPEEFKKLSKQVTIVSEAVKHGIEIK